MTNNPFTSLAMDLHGLVVLDDIFTPFTLANVRELAPIAGNIDLPSSTSNILPLLMAVVCVPDNFLFLP
jgi:hypothetical protein